MLLFEQTLNALAQQIAATYPSNYAAQYKQAAVSLRAPFWDWAAETYVPAATVNSMVTIHVPNGQALKQVSVPNPLFSYAFPQQAIDGQFGKFYKGTKSVRCPAPNNWPGTANSDLASRPYKQWTYDIFTTSPDFATFATTGSNGVSLEGVHNAIHWDATCGGMFLKTQWSGFEPLFMLHHANVDRLWAYWEYSKPNVASWSVPYAGGSRWGVKPGTQITANSPLQPFFQANGSPHTTNSVNSITKFGYSYVGLEYWEKSAAQMQNDSIAIINQLYGSGTSVSTSASVSLKRSQGDLVRYFVEIDLDVTQVERPCQVTVSIKGHTAGSMVVMPQPATGITHGGFTLDNAVWAAGVHGNDVETTMSAIQNLLEVEIVTADGTTISVSSVPSLNVQVQNLNVTQPASINEFPQVVGKKGKTAIAGGKKVPKRGLRTSFGIEV